MAAAQFDKFRKDVTKKLHEPNKVNDVLGQIEAKTGLERFYLVAGVAGMVALYMIFGHFAELVCNFVGFLYPAYVSIKAIESATKDDDTQWLTYWVVFALFSCVEFASDFIVGWFPIYWLVKCAFMVWLYLPNTRGATVIYTKVVRPFVQKHQGTIEAKLGAASHKVADAARAVGDEFGKMD